MDAVDKYKGYGPYHLCFIKALETLSTIKGRAASVANVSALPAAVEADAAGGADIDEEEAALSVVSYDSSVEDDYKEGEDGEQQIMHDNQRHPHGSVNQYATIR
jgi:hypothetical protein